MDRLKEIGISERFFSEDEIKSFFEKHGYNIVEISYAAEEEIDFSDNDQKSFLFENGYPKILDRFFQY